MQAFDNKVLLGDGRLLWQQCTVRGLFDEAGRITEFQAVMQDITRRKESEEALRLGEERFRAILDSMVDGVIVLDKGGLRDSLQPGGGEDFPATAWRRCCDQSVQELFAPDDWPKYDDYLARHLGKIRPKSSRSTPFAPTAARCPSTWQ